MKEEKEEKKHIEISLTTALCIVAVFIILFSTFTLWYWAKKTGGVGLKNKYAVTTSTIVNV